MHQYIPHAMLPDSKTLPWMTKALVNAIKMRNCYFRKSKQTGDEAAFLKYKQLRNKVVKGLCEAKQSFFSGLHPSNKQFWKTLRQINTTKTTIPVLSSCSNVTTIAPTNTEKSNLLNSYTSRTVLMSEYHRFHLVICAILVPVYAQNISLQTNLKYTNYLLALMRLSPLVLTK